MKYIPADKLIAEIRKLRSESCISESDDYYEYAKSEIIDIITSLQQEQPEVDLDKEIKDACREYRINDYHEQELGKHDIENIARYFYELGQNARKLQPEVDLDALVDEAFDKYSSVDGYSQLSVSFNRAELYSFIKKIARKEE